MDDNISETLGKDSLYLQSIADDTPPSQGRSLTEEKAGHPLYENMCDTSNHCTNTIFIPL